MKLSGLIIVTVFMLLFGGCNSKSNKTVMFDQDMKLSEILQVADSIAKEGDTEKALATYNFITKQASHLTPSDSINGQIALNASLSEAEIYFSKNNDYGNTLNALMQAKKIVTRHSLSEIPVDFMLGVVYMTIGEQNNVDSYLDKSAEYFVNILDNACEKDSRYVDYAVSNLILCSDKGKVNKISKEALDRYFSSTSNKRNHDGYKFNMTLDSIMKCLHKREYNTALDIINRLSKSSRLPHQRVLPSIFFISGKISAESGNYGEALSFYRESEKHVDPQYGQDMALQVYEALEDTYSRLGNEYMTGKYAEKANKLRREMTSFSQICSFKQAELANEMDTIETNLNLEMEKSRNLRRWSVISLTFVVLAAIIIGMLLYFMKRLKEKNEVLYIRYVELLKLSNSSMPPSCEGIDLVEDISQVQGDKPTVIEECQSDEESYDIDGSSGYAEPMGSSYTHDLAVTGTSQMFTEEVNRIEEVLADSEELFSCEFSATKLAILSGIKPRMLSTIISDYYHTSFRNLINSRRIRAVCRKLETGTDYDNLTVDAIAESIGIKSRATFTSAFKRETGMTPAQYIRFALKRKGSLRDSI